VAGILELCAIDAKKANLGGGDTVGAK
jgi:hypothetical protein